MPWRNGGGTTTEIVVGPDGSGRFLYRVSIADVASDGPFSRFDGYDRHIMLLSGRGMTLEAGPPASTRIDLTAALEPRSFSGDWDIHGALVDGPVRDFNLIVDRTRASSSLSVHRFATRETIAVAAGDVCVVHVVDGALTTASTHDTLILDASTELVAEGDVVLALAHVMPHDQA
jgi:environmental stress-induced protein Ves